VTGLPFHSIYAHGFVRVASNTQTDRRGGRATPNGPIVVSVPCDGARSFFALAPRDAEGEVWLRELHERVPDS
jgi:hypothetical protein